MKYRASFIQKIFQAATSIETNLNFQEHVVRQIRISRVLSDIFLCALEIDKNANTTWSIDISRSLQHLFKVAG